MTVLVALFDDWLPVVLAVVLAMVHLLTRSDALMGWLSRSRILSFGGGVSVAYVFVHVLPEVDEFRAPLNEHPLLPVPTEKEVYLIVLLGFVTFYGLDRLGTESAEESDDGNASVDVFLVHIASYSAYNGIAGYLLFHQETPGVRSLLLFSLALGAHFLLNDVALQEQHEDAYHEVGRWVLAGAVLVGAAIGAATELPRPVLGLLFAFLAGGIVLNVIREELPSDRNSKFLPFTLGVAFYTVMLLAS